MSLQTYWDLSEKQRANLTEEQVRACCDVALAEAGVLKPIEPPKYEKPKTAALSVPKPYWAVEFRYHAVCFRTVEQAQQFLALEPVEKDSDYDIGSQYVYGRPIVGHPSVISLFDYSEILAHKAELSNYNAAQKANEKAIQQYNEDTKAVEKATADIWSDWYQCRETQGRYQRILDVKAEYLGLANGDNDIASGFLAKAFNEEDITSAEEWFKE